MKQITICFSSIPSLIVLIALNIIGSLSSFASTDNEASAIDIQEYSGSTINKKTHYLIANTTLTIDSVLKIQHGFTPNRQNFMNFGYFNKEVWLKFSVSGNGKEQLILEHHPYHTDTIQLFCVKSTGELYQTESAGLTHLKKGDKSYFDIKSGRYALPFEIDSGINHIYLKISSDYAAVRTTLKLWHLDDYKTRDVSVWDKESFRYVILGFSIFAAIIGILLAIYTRTWVYCAYSLFLLSNIANIFAVKGWIAPYLPWFNFFEHDIRGLCNSINVIVSLWYFYLLIPAVYSVKIIRKTMLIISSIVLLLLVSSLVIPASYASYKFYVLTFKPLFFAAAILSIAHFYTSAKKGFLLSWIFLISLTPIVINVFLHALQLFNIIEITYPNYLWEFAILFELAIYTGVMVYRYKEIVDQKSEVESLLQKNKKRYIHNLFAAQENERMRIARDLHDSVGQKLSVVNMYLSAISEGNNQKEITKVRNLLNETIQDVRIISHNLIPEELNLGLSKAIENIADRINESRKITMTVNIEENTAMSCTKETELMIYRIVQEILNNTIKHSGASSINTTIDSKKKDWLQITIKDNGKGLNPEQIENSEGIGWQNIFARIKLINGTLHISSENKKGTFIKLNIPLNEPDTN